MNRSTSTLTARSETGSVTRIAATLNLEERHGLVVDGQVGPATWAALF